MEKAANSGDGGSPAAPVDKQVCGIVMPISAIDGRAASHWGDVLEVVKEAAETAGFAARLVSAADYAGIILGEIVGNLYNDPIVVADVSARNPNVMFELGMRLAFDKPTIVIKDDKTDYAFDISSIEHLGYPSDLRYQAIVQFKQDLAEKIKATHEKAAKNDYKSFLKHFGTFKVATVEVKEVGREEFIMNEMREIKAIMRHLTAKFEAGVVTSYPNSFVPSDAARLVHITNIDDEQIDLLKRRLELMGLAFSIVQVGKDRVLLRVRDDASTADYIGQVRDALTGVAPNSKVRLSSLSK